MSTTRRAQELADTIRALRASRLSAADKEKICGLLTLLETPIEQMTPDQLRQAREAAGLSLGQAARLLQVAPGTLLAIEKGIATGEGLGCWPSGLCDRMNRVYRLEPAEECP